MRRSRILVALGVITAVIGITVSAGAATRTVTPPKIGHAKKLDLSSLAKIHAYLRSRGINPRHVVIQRGTRNYAGPHCPGRGWTCTTATRVLQVGGQNSFECPTNASPRNDNPAMQTCVVAFQSGQKNEFVCVEKTTVSPSVQDCEVTQQGPSTSAIIASNSAIIYQLADQSTGSGQDATQKASVHQSLASNNQAQIRQIAQQFTGEGTTQSQDAHQFVDVNQSATGTVGNFAHVDQQQNQQEQGSATTQTQNKGLTTDDCAPGSTPTAPNECALVQQTTDDGINNGHLHQELFEDMATNTKPTLQQQGIDPLTGATSGLKGDIPQLVTGQGTNNQHGHETKRLHVSAPSGSPAPMQFDGGRCCGISATGGTNSTSQVVQDGAVSGPPNAIQTVSLVGQSHVQPNFGFAPTDGGSTSGGGGCHITQHGSVNDAASGESVQDAPPCLDILITICSTGEGGHCQTGAGELAPSSLVMLLPTSPTNGVPLSADIFGEPSDYTGPAFPIP